MERAKEISAAMWAEGVANQVCKFSDVPDEFREDVKKLLDKLLDPNAPVLSMTQTNYVMRNGKLERD